MHAVIYPTSFLYVMPAKKLTMLFSSDIAEYVNASFETNPLDGKCDQRIRMSVQPLEIIYHAVSIKWTISFNMPPLSHYSAVWLSKVEGGRVPLKFPRAIGYGIIKRK